MSARPPTSVGGYDDLTAGHPAGRFLIRHDGTQWQDGPCPVRDLVDARFV